MILLTQKVGIKGKFETENWLIEIKKFLLLVLDLPIFMDQEIIIKLKIGF